MEAGNAVCENLDRNSDGSYPFDFGRQTREDFTSEGIFFVLDNIGMGHPSACVQPIQYFSCLITAPPCSNVSDLPLRICPESCLAFDMLMAGPTCNAFNNTLVTLDLESFVALRDLYFQFDCMDTSTYSYSGQNGFDEERCTNIFSADVQGWFLKALGSGRILPHCVSSETEVWYFQCGPTAQNINLISIDIQS